MRCNLQPTDVPGEWTCGNPGCGRTIQYAGTAKPSARCRARPRGLGDTVANFTRATGIAAAVDGISYLTGIDCGCDERQEALNKLLPYTPQSPTPDR